MKRSIILSLEGALFVAAMGLSCAAQADFELTTPDGRRIRLSDNGTWLYVEQTNKAQAADSDKAAGEALLLLESKKERGNNCRFRIQLVNNLPYEIRNLVPFYSAYRANGVLHDTVASLSAFTSLKPGDKQERDIDFTGITCQDIARVQVVGGDRCEMGELYKFSQGEGMCLARVRVVASDLVRFDK